jgi:hypothetical protein
VFPERVQSGAKAKAIARGVSVWIMITVIVTDVYILYGVAGVGSSPMLHQDEVRPSQRVGRCGLICPSGKSTDHFLAFSFDAASPGGLEAPKTTLM